MKSKSQWRSKGHLLRKAEGICVERSRACGPGLPKGDDFKTPDTGHDVCPAWFWLCFSLILAVSPFDTVNFYSVLVYVRNM